ncbi:hypothetical protein D9619_006287 [Psilocybe cf. subviscida]|uniref:Nitrogen regulatory protein areA GATA-like domain-containing protein n=1 Tax=Psilocybe cf. subviscida TaxID=2480587 RepID=A0A8H5B4Q3_9AGAR|nr:hypothetical protein D9619_006287 [Psilocybe cf. subviscida]
MQAIDSDSGQWITLSTICDMDAATVGEGGGGGSRTSTTSPFSPFPSRPPPMAHYLPVLLVSVNTNAVPDDSALVTLPRGQVDYLSHEWQEEDVWRSWRNMTRQKNAIANGARLENASWRTWWKQRNKLKTVSPETLNWLKDSDVTWLYGPLHTAVEWTPPPKPQPVPDSVDAVNPASAYDRLDLSNPSFLNIANARRAEARPAKPILKHRSIGELLTGGDYQPSTVVSPMDSEDDEDDDKSPNSPQSHHDKNVGTPMRPSLTHTKSDTHIIRWGGSRAFRKDSPPRIDPPGFDAHNANYFPPHDSTSSLIPSTSSASIPSSSHPGFAAAPEAIRSSVSQDSTSTSSGGHEKPEKQKKKHISFNTFVEQYIAIEKPKKNASGFFGAIGPAQYGSLYGAGSSASFNSIGNHNDDGVCIAGEEAFIDDDGYDEDEEEDDDDLMFKRRNSAAWQSEMEIGAAMGVRAIRDDSDESPADEGLEDVDEVVEEDEEDGEDDGVIQIRSRRGSSSSTLRPAVFKTPKKNSRSSRSQSKVSTSSSSSATSTSSAASGSSQSHGTTPGTSTSTSPNSSLSPSRKPRKNSATSTVSAGSGLTATPSDASTSTNLPNETSRKRVPSSSYRPSTLPPGYTPSYHAHRPPLIRTPSEHVHVTIAPIAPTLLKTTGAWSEGFGDDASDDGGFGGLYGWASGSLDKAKSDRSRSGSSSRSGSRSGSGSGERERDGNRQSGRNHGRGNGFSSPTIDLDPARDLGIPTNGGGYIANPSHGEESIRRGRRWGFDPEDEDSAQVSDGTPVELVYVPPLGSNYSFGMNGVHYGGGPYADGIYNINGGYMQQGGLEEEVEEAEQDPTGVHDEDDDDEGSADAVYHHPPLSSSPGLGTTAPIPIASVTQYPPIPEVANGTMRGSQNFTVSTSAPKSTAFMQQRPGAGTILGANSPSVKTVSNNNTNLEEEDENDFFGDLI